MSDDDAYSAVADEQLDALDNDDDADLYNAILEACGLVFEKPSRAQARSTAIQTAQGVRFRLPVVGFEPYKVFWSITPDGPRIEAVFPHH